jgi:DNA-binding NtrC family response regulator
MHIKNIETPRILVIENLAVAQTLIEQRFNGGLLLESAPTLQAALNNHKRKPFDLVVWDTRSAPPVSAEIADSVNVFSQNSIDTQIVIISDLSEPILRKDLHQRCSWLQPPVHETEFLEVIGQALCGGRSHCESEKVNRDTGGEFEGILGISLSMRPVIQQILEAATVNVPVLISGETGTGKELVAAAIHKCSQRKHGPYLTVNLGAIAPELIAAELFGHERGAYTGASEARPGFFEQAQGGTIFLDEITTTNEKTQVSLLRVLETKTIRRVRGEKDIGVDVRVIAATNENIDDLVRSRRFREDLYYRLDVFRLHVPPLRERHGAIALLTDHFISRFNEMYGKQVLAVSADAYRSLRRYPWPGNVRELKNVIQRAILTAKTAELTADLLPERVLAADDSRCTKNNAQPIQLGMTLAQVEKEFIKMTLASVGGSKMKAAAILRISRRALYNKLGRFGLL